MTPADGHSQSPQETPHHPVEVRSYLFVFAALLALTVITVTVASLKLAIAAAVVIALAIAITKASLVAVFFMHLKGERPMVYWPLGLTAVLFLALFAFLLWSDGDHLLGTRFLDAFNKVTR